MQISKGSKAHTVVKKVVKSPSLSLLSTLKLKTLSIASVPAAKKPTVYKVPPMKASILPLSQQVPPRKEVALSKASASQPVPKQHEMGSRYTYF